jgi:hypothetical protein
VSSVLYWLWGSFLRGQTAGDQYHCLAVVVAFDLLEMFEEGFFVGGYSGCKFIFCILLGGKTFKELCN